MSAEGWHTVEQLIPRSAVKAVRMELEKWQSAYFGRMSFAIIDDPLMAGAVTLKISVEDPTQLFHLAILITCTKFNATSPKILQERFAKLQEGDRNLAIHHCFGYLESSPDCKFWEALESYIERREQDNKGKEASE